MYDGLYLPVTLNATIYADPRLAPGLDPALQPLRIPSQGRTLIWRLEFTDALGVISRVDPGTAVVEVFRARATWTPGEQLEWARYGPPRTGVMGQEERWDTAIPGAFTWRVSGVAGATGTHYRLWVKETN